jgi:hypothetical protein
MEAIPTESFGFPPFLVAQEEKMFSLGSMRPIDHLVKEEI